MSHTVLSLVLSGKRPLSKKAAIKISDALALSPDERAAIFKRFKKPGDMPEIVEDSYQHLQLEAFEAVSNWYYYAILSLLETKGAKWDQRWIGQKLSIPPAQAKVAMDNLVNLGLVARQGLRWRQTGLPLKIDNVHTSAAAKRWYKQILEKSLGSLENDPFDIRSHTCITFAVDPKHLPYAREKIRQFRLSLARELERKGNCTRVYKLALQLFPVSEDSQEKS